MNSAENPYDWRSPWKLLAHPAVLVGFVISLKVVLLGEIYIGELFAAFYFFRSRRSISRPQVVLMLAALTWSIAQLASDILNHSQAADLVKGVGTPVLFVITLFGLQKYFSALPKRMAPFLIGAAIGFLVNQPIHSPSYFFGNPWKWGIGTALMTIIAVAFSFQTRSRARTPLLALLVAIFSVVSVYLSSRSIALLADLGLVLTWLFAGSPSRPISRFLSGKLSVLKALIIVVPAVLALNYAASAILSSEGVLSSLPLDVAEKYRMQSGGEYGILVGGRSEMLVSIKAFFDAPFLGHGSWAKDFEGYNEMRVGLAYQLGYSDIDTTDELTDLDGLLLIPAHSYVMSALVWAGALGGLFWLILMGKLASDYLAYKSRLGFYFHWGMLSFFFNAFFSPFGADARWATAVFLAAFFSLAEFEAKRHSRHIHEDLHRHNFIQSGQVSPSLY